MENTSLTLLIRLQDEGDTAAWDRLFGLYHPEIAAQEMGISLNAVFIAKSQVLKRLRHEAAGLVDSSLDFS